MKNDFKDEVQPTVPEKGHVTIRSRIRNVNHGINIEIQIRTLGPVTYGNVARNAIVGILGACIREGMDPSDVQPVLDEAEQAWLDDSTKTWGFGSDAD